MRGLMQSFIWDENYLTGLSDVDEQHHGLVDLLNECGDMLARNDTHKTACC